MIINNSQVIAVYKPVGPTSAQIVALVKKISGVKKVGHAGTLDPLARGVLVIGIGRAATRKLGEIVGEKKEYLATVKLGAESTTDDAEGEKTKLKIKNKPALGEIKKITAEFIGRIEQTPPIFSALKIKGRRAYRLARLGKNFTLPPRPVEIKKIKILSYRWPYLKLKVVTGPGVYIRALARDLGNELGVGGYLYALERTRVGRFTKQKAVAIKNLAGVLLL